MSCMYILYTGSFWGKYLLKMAQEMPLLLLVAGEWLYHSHMELDKIGFAPHLIPVLASLL